MIEPQETTGAWPEVVDAHPDSNGQARSVRVTMATTTLDRPIDKLVLILENEE